MLEVLFQINEGKMDYSVKEQLVSHLENSKNRYLPHSLYHPVLQMY